jgi:hypothetical protein
MNARCLGRRSNTADDEFSVTAQIIRVEADRWCKESRNVVQLRGRLELRKHAGNQPPKTIRGALIQFR